MLHRFAIALRFLGNLMGGLVLLGAALWFGRMLLFPEPWEVGAEDIYPGPLVVAFFGALILAVGRGLCWILVGNTSRPQERV